MLAGRSGAAEITQFDSSRYSVHFACEVKGFDPTEFIDRKQARRMDRFAHLVVAAARLAERDSGLDIASEPDRIGATHVPQVRDRRERGGRDPRALRRVLDALRSLRGVLDQPFDLGAQLAAPRVELEQHRFGGLAGEPELAALRIPADAVFGDRRDARREQLVTRHDGQVRELAWIAPDEHEHRAEPRRLRLEHEIETTLRIIIGGQWKDVVALTVFDWGK